jgi:hypothetical protein
MSWVSYGYYGGGGAGKAQKAEMKIQAQVNDAGVFIFIRESRYPPEVNNPSESAIQLSRQQAKEFAEQILEELAWEDS